MFWDKKTARNNVEGLLINLHPYTSFKKYVVRQTSCEFYSWGVTKEKDLSLIIINLVMDATYA